MRPSIPHIAHLRFVGNAPERDDSPVLELERWNLAQLFLRPRQVAHNEASPDLPQLFVFLQTADVPQAFGHNAARRRGLIDPDPLPAKVLCRYQRRAAAAECVQYNVIRL